MSDFSENINQVSAKQRLLLALNEATAKLEAVERSQNEPIAIIGMGCRFPGNANNPEAFWQQLHDGVDAIAPIPTARWNTDTYYDPDPDAPGKIYTRCGGFLPQVDQFDAQFFGISPREAINLDPQQRLLLEVSWEALENAGQAPNQLIGSKTGVFVGIGQNDYAQLQMFSGNYQDINPYAGTGNGFAFASGRLSYILGLQGPNLAVDTACSASLVSVHLACQSLRAGECELALAGGVHLILSPEVTIFLSKARVLSADGRCKTFDASANGYGRGEGCGMLVLKRLSDAVANGDRILALIRGSAVNHDGQSSGLTVPNKQAQQALISQALTNAKVDPLQVSYVEVHGTGTSLGDPIEIRALGEVLTPGRSRANPLIVGSVKTNIGHLEAAAGIASLIKVVLSLQHKEIPPHLHFSQPNPHINWDELPIVVPTSKIPWSSNQKLLAGVSSFGFSGTNAHLIVEEAPLEIGKQLENTIERPVHLLALSAKTLGALQQLAQDYEKYIQNHPDLALADICFTAACCRSHFQYRLSIVASNKAEVVEKLAAFPLPQEKTRLSKPHTNKRPKIAFLFTGQGSQYVNMGRQLYQTSAIFRQTLEECATILAPYLEKPLLNVLYPQTGESSPINETGYAQPALFALEYALCQLWRSWGIEPDAVMGHSLGEYVAATVAGVFSLEDALKLVATRASLMQSLSSDGGMLAVFAELELVEEVIQPYTDLLAVAAINGLRNIVISGENLAIEQVQAIFSARGVESRPINVSHAFHSPAIEPILAEFAQAAKEVVYAQPRIRLISNLTGEIATSAIATPEYWSDHLRQSVKFAASMEVLYRQGYEVFVEIGPKPILLGMASHCLPEEVGIFLPSLHSGQEDWQQLLQSLGKLYLCGATIDWSGFDQDYTRRRVALPTYPFQRERYWVETVKRGANTSKLHAKSNTPTLYPLLGQRLHLANTKEIRFESNISQDFPAYLAHHRIYEKVILPATAYLEIALAAGAVVFKSNNLILEEVVIQQVLMLEKDASKTLQVILTPEDSKTFSWQIFSFNFDENNSESYWGLHAFGKVFVEGHNPPLKVDLAALQTQYTEEISVTNYYQQLRQRGIHYGSSFQAIEKIWRNQGQALGQICLPETLILEVEDYKLHPVLLDACLQVIGTALAEADQQAIYLPVGLERLQLYRRPTTHLWTQVKIRQVEGFNQKTVTAEIDVFDESGNVVAQLVGLTVKSITRQALEEILPQEDFSNWLYENIWQAQERITKQQPVTSAQPGNWMLFVDEGEIGIMLATLLREEGDRCVLVSAAKAYAKLTEEHYQINPTNPADFQQLLLDSQENHQQLYSGVIFLWSLKETSLTDITLATLQEVQKQICGSVLHLLQSLAQSKASVLPRLCLVTRGTQIIGESQATPQVQQAPLWGLGRVIALEHPDLHCLRLDLDPSTDKNEILTLVEELRSPDKEDQVAYRQGVRYVPRLVRYPSSGAIKSQEKISDLPTEPFQLKISNYGILENLTLAPMTRRPPKPEEVEIQVCACGLNFRDVLNALGLLQEYTRQQGIDSATDIPFGGECAGKIVAVGKNVSKFEVGDEVIAVMTLGSLSSFVTVKADFVVPKPPELSFEAAATILTTFLTAYYGLHHQAKIQPGDKILIHAAAGGVGQAALQLAQRAGAEIFATASPSKWEYLKSTGVKQVMNSRTLDFAEEVMAMTNERGVDIVLNSLNGDFIPKSLEVLAPEGRFVEIGKIGIWDRNQVQAKRPDTSYYAFDLLEISMQNPSLITSMLEELMEEFKQGNLKPLNYKAFPIDRVVDGFRYMQKAKHIGKVVISIPQAREGNGSYLITGGLGALGLQVARWLVEERGVRHLVLIGRQEGSQAAQATVTQLQETGINVRVCKADVSVREDVVRILEEVKVSMPPLRGIIHAAGVLDDGVLLSQTWERFSQVMAPKMAGAWNLHILSEKLPLDFFVCFSSSASLLGSPGQGNYAAANAFMDALVHYRRGLGLPGLSINWGPWADAGMAEEITTRDRDRWATLGISAIKPEQGLQVFARLLEENAAQVGVLPINWSKFLKELDLPFLELCTSASEQPQTQEPEFLQQLKAAPLKERKTLLMAYIRSQIAKVVGLKSLEEIEPRQRLFDLGLDSLVAVELKNWLERGLGKSLRSTLLFDYPTVEALGDYLIEDVLSMEFSSTSSQELPPVVEDTEFSALKEMSQEEIADLLAKKLASLD